MLKAQLRAKKNKTFSCAVGLLLQCMGNFCLGDWGTEIYLPNLLIFPAQDRSLWLLLLPCGGLFLTSSSP